MKKLSLVFVLGILAASFSGCIRFVGGAGYQYQGADDEAPKSKSVGFDTATMIPGSLPPEARIENATN